MKIDPELRKLIVTTQKDRFEARQARFRNSQKDIKAFLKKSPAAAAALKKAKVSRAQIKAHEKKIEQLHTEVETALAPFGLELERWSEEVHISDEAAFVAVGGRPFTSPAYRTNQVLTRLAQTKTQEDFDKVLAEYDINWK